jgi:triacylglycerol lipase
MLFLSSCNLSNLSVRDRPSGEANQDFINTAPIILVHGFGGWGRDTVAGMHYWGGFRDLESELRQSGYRVMTAEVGPFSSHWDRACELYACIKGGVVDYGAAHSAAYGHERFGRIYPGLYPEWDEEHPVHIIGHSMGGTTGRLLISLLRNGVPDEWATDVPSPLFRGGTQSIASLATVSTPHNGTTLIMGQGNVESLIRALVRTLGVMAGSDLLSEYPIQLEHWDLQRDPEESLSDYFQRLWVSDFWDESNPDSALADLTPEAMTRFNARYPADPQVRYISWATEATSSGLFSREWFPEPDMLPLFMPSSAYMGSFSPGIKGIEDREWWPNDGVVNTVSMSGPILGSRDEIRELDGSPQPGVWNFAGVLSSTDHAAVLGIPFWGPVDHGGYGTASEFYAALCELLLDNEGIE